MARLARCSTYCNGHVSSICYQRVWCVPNGVWAQIHLWIDSLLKWPTFGYPHFQSPCGFPERGCSILGSWWQLTKLFGGGKNHLPDGKINHVQTTPVIPSLPERRREREREFPECSFKTRSMGGFWFPGNVHLMVFGSQTGWNEVWVIVFQKPCGVVTLTRWVSNSR